jgi:hypothetical protein
MFIDRGIKIDCAPEEHYVHVAPTERNSKEGPDL